MIDKFETAVATKGLDLTSADIFVLVDESHRGQYGPLHARMRKVMANACFLGFTGTPVMKAEKDTIRRFGGLIDTYTITQAVADRSVVPLLYEGRYVPQMVDREQIDRWFDRITQTLRPRQGPAHPRRDRRPDGAADRCRPSPQNLMLSRRLRVGGGWINYSLRFATTERLSITVRPDLSVSAVAPAGVEPLEVDRRVLRRLAWIVRQQRSFGLLHPLPTAKRYVSGETHLYLGRQYRLRVCPGPFMVELAPPFLKVSAPRPGATFEVARLVRAWYRERARDVISRRLEEFRRRARWLGGSDAPIRLREMRRRWGSCGATGLITLNPLLVMTPIPCVDYVIAHELAHRLELRHSRRFYGLLRRAIPDWERVKSRLDRLPVSS